MDNLTLGIDPGNKGAIAVFINHKLKSVIDAPTVVKRQGSGRMYCAEGFSAITGQILADMGHSDSYQRVAFVESVHAMPKQGVTSMFYFGYGCGVIDGVLRASGFRVHYVTPQMWKRGLGLIGKDKQASAKTATELYPDFADMFAPKTKDGRAEAALIGYWGIKNYQY
jgi:crossover junction endodeoxyribonuclease RuvC